MKTPDAGININMLEFVDQAYNNDLPYLLRDMADFIEQHSPEFELWDVTIDSDILFGDETGAIKDIERYSARLFVRWNEE